MMLLSSKVSNSLCGKKNGKMLSQKWMTWLSRMLGWDEGGACGDRVAWHMLKDAVLVLKQAKSIKKKLWAQNASGQQKETKFNSVRVHVSGRECLQWVQGEASGIEPSSWRERYVPACNIDARQRVCRNISKRKKILVIVILHYWEEERWLCEKLQLAVKSWFYNKEELHKSKGMPECSAKHMQKG